MYGAGGVETTAAAAMGHFFGYPTTVGGAAGMMLAAGGRGELEDEQLKRQKEVIYRLDFNFVYSSYSLSIQYAVYSTIFFAFHSTYRTVFENILL